MALSKREVFTFTWRIASFSYCPQQTGEVIRSPSFIVAFMNKSEWQLQIYPRSEKGNGDNFSFYLSSKEDYTKEVGFALTLFSITGKEIKRSADSHVFKKNEGWGWSIFCSRMDIFNIANGHLPNDTLTLMCEMWKNADGNNGGGSHSAPAFSDSFNFKAAKCKWAHLGSISAAESAPNRMREPINKIPAVFSADCILNVETEFDCNEYESLTHVNVSRKSVVWSIKNINQSGRNKKLMPPIIKTSEAGPSLLFTLYLTRQNFAQKCLRIEISKTSPKTKQVYFVKCKISVLNAAKRILFAKEDEHFCDTDDESDIWVFPGIIDLIELNVFGTSIDIVYIRCELAFTTHANVNHAEEKHIGFSDTIRPPDEKNSVVSIFKEMYSDEEFCDLVIRSGDREFKTHKIVLAAQSSVFKAMFHNDMMEKQNGVVEISDVDENTLRLMLDFMYGDNLKITDYVEAANLYAAANKYEIQPLKSFCSSFIKFVLSISNVVSVISLADLHQDNELMSEAKSFIRFNIREVFNSEAWTEFMQSNYKLAGDIMFNLLKSQAY